MEEPSLASLICRISSHLPSAKMSISHEFPEDILHEVIAAVIASTRFSSWQLSLRLVNRTYFTISTGFSLMGVLNVDSFNEAVLHVFYLRKRIATYAEGHSFDCIKPCYHQFCLARASTRLRSSHVHRVRFTFQRFLAIRDLPGDATKAYQLLQRWEEALVTLRGVECFRQLDSNQLSSYSTCSNNPIFNDLSSAILSEALCLYLGAAHLTYPPWTAKLPDRYHTYPPTFWVALCACVLGDTELLETCMRKLSSIGDTNDITQSPSDPSVEDLLGPLLEMALRYRESRLLTRILEHHSSMILSVRTDFKFLRVAIAGNNKEVLKALLQHTPNSSNLLTGALSDCGVLLPRSSSGSEIIRLLTQHFAPLSAESRAWLIMHSCSVGDVTLLEDFFNTGSLFEHRISAAPNPTYMHFAISFGNANSLRFLLSHGVFEPPHGHEMIMAVQQALSFNQMKCYGELYQHFDGPLPERSGAMWFPRSAMWFPLLGMAENSEDIMTDFISKDKSLILQPFEDPQDARPTLAQRALWNSIERLRPRNIQLLLNEGVCVLPCPDSRDEWSSGDPFEIPWPYFNQNRDAFACAQAVLDAFDLPKLRVLV
jgi:hypothetical protein